jgi:hypothetical protein
MIRFCCHEPAKLPHDIVPVRPSVLYPEIRAGRFKIIHSLEANEANRFLQQSKVRCSLAASVALRRKRVDEY